MGEKTHSLSSSTSEGLVARKVVEIDVVATELSSLAIDTGNVSCDLGVLRAESTLALSFGPESVFGAHCEVEVSKVSISKSECLY